MDERSRRLRRSRSRRWTRSSSRVAEGAGNHGGSVMLIGEGRSQRMGGAVTRISGGQLPVGAAR